MATKRASIPQGKALFFRQAETAVTEERAETIDDLAVRPEGPERLERTSAERAATAKAPTRQSAIFLEEQHIDWLEDRCREARRNGGRAIRKAAIIRALLDVAMDAGVDLTGLRREEDITQRIREALRS